MKKNILHIFSLISLVFLSLGVWGQTIVTFTSSTTWTCPAGVTSVTVECWGGGGGGGGGKNDTDAGGGGGGGEYASSTLTVVPGNTYTITVGAGGIGVEDSKGLSGGNSSFNSLVVANGGSGGGKANNGAGGVGGTGGTGNFTRNGGNGAAGSDNNYSGGGGGGAGTANNGSNATTSTGGLGGATGGGNGANGITADGNGNAATANYGGGGGGARGKDRIGGKGMNGYVRLTYSASGSYCAHNNTVNTSYYISAFSTTGGATNITNNSSGFSTNGYGNFTAQTVTQSAGSSVNFSITSGNGTMNYGIWVDWNEDGDFADSGEQMLLTSTMATSASGTITVPGGASQGNKRMRVTSEWMSGSAVYCTGGSYTECEDYTFIVSAPPSCPAPSSLSAGSITTTQAVLNWTENGSATLWDIELGVTGFTPSGTPTRNDVTNPYTYIGLSASTTYQYYVRADCGGGDYSTWSGPYSFTTTCQGIGGTVNVGSGQTYTTLTGAGGLFEKINQCGLIGDLIVNITSDITEPGTNDLNQWAGTYTLTIQPSAATVRVISGTLSDGLIRLDGADRVTFNGNYAGSGQYLRFQNTSSTSPASVFEIVNDAGNLTIANCLIEGGYYGVYYYYNDANTNVISNSSIYDFQYYGLYSYYSDGSLSLSQNSIYTTTSKNNNRYAIYLYESESVLVEKNKIYDILPGSSCYAYGIYTSYSNSVIRNNMISLSPANNYYVYGIYYFGSTSYTTDIYFNSIYIGGSGTSAYSSYGVYKSSAASAFNFKNNIVYNNRTASTANHYALYFSSSSGINSDHNQLYASNATYGYVGYWVSTACKTLANWQASSSKDAYSFGVLPSFVGANDLHITAGTGLVGLAIAGITDDFDGELRTSPAIGADEIAIPACSGIPNAGVATISVASGCSGISFNIGTTGLSLAPGISYQWQSSPNGTDGWVDISGATSPSYSSSVSTTTYYRLVSTCSYSSQTNETNVVSFTVTGNDCVCVSYSDNYAYYTSYEDIGNVVVGTLNNTSILGALAGGEGSVAYEYSNYTGIVSAPDLQQLANVSFSVTSIISSGSSNNGFQIYIDYDHDGTFESTERAYSSPTATSGAHTETGSFVIPIDALTGITRMRVVCVRTTFPSSSNYAESYYSYGETEDYCVNITPAPECSGTPDAGTATISTANGCADVNFTLSATGLTAATGISYQWQSSANGTTGWADISGAISTTYVTSTSVTRYYRLVTTCSLSSQTNETNVVSYTVTGNACVCESYSDNYAYYTSYEDIGNVVVGTLNNTSILGALAGGEGSVAYEYSNYTGIVSAPDLQQLANVSFSVTSIISSGSSNNGFQIYIDYDHDGTFESTERAYSSPTATSGAHTETGSFVIPIDALTGITRMRVVCVRTTFPSSSNYAESYYSYGETEDYCVNITPAPECSGTPDAGTATISTANGCADVNFTLSATGLTAATGISYQWQASANGTTGWADISGAISTTYVASTSVTKYYRLVTTCSLSSQTNETNVVSYTVTGNACVCESYPESYSNFYTSDEDIGNVTVGTLNNSSTLGELAAGANSEAYVYSNYAGVVAAPDLQQLEEVSFSLSSIISSGSYNNGFQIFIDYNQDGVFSNTERVYSSPSAIAGAHTETGSFIVPITAMPGITRMRVINIEETFPTSTNYTTSTPYDYGETEDYCVNITLAPNCDATPNAGTASINFASGCLSTPHTVTATGLSAATGIQFHWQYSLDGSTGWTDIEDADASSYTNITDVTTYYRLKSTCSFTGLSNFTNVVSYTVTGNDCCVSTLNLYDDATDGWGGDYVTVTVGGTVLGTYTLASGAGPFTIYITSDADEAISIVYTGTNNYSDSYFDLIGPGGNYYAQDWYPTDYSTYYDGPWNGRGCPIPQPGDMCEMSIAFCTGTNYSFPTGVDNPPAPDGPEYGCLSTQPNPVYYYLRIDQPGSMEILIESDCGDVDFAAWGPFDATTCDPLDLTAAGNPGTGGNYDQPYGNLVDCAYSTAAIEYLSIPDAEVGEYYMVMINNFANCDGIISFEQISGEGSSDCSIVAPPVSNNGPYCVGQDIELSVNYPVTGASYNWTGPNGFTSTVMNPTITNADPSDSGTYSLIITVGSEVSEPETTDVTVSNPQPLTTVAAGDFVFRNIGTDWNTASNWLECTGADAYIVSAIVPTALDNVVICAGTTCASSEAIIYTSGATCNNITIESGCVLTVDGAHSLTVHSNWTNNGTFNPSTGTVVFNGTSNVLGSTISHDFYNVTINASKIMTAPATNMNVMGNWTNNGTFNHNTGTVTLLGSSAQNVSSGINSQFYNLTVQNSSTGILLLDDAEVLNILTLNDGVVSTSANKLISRSISTNAIDGFSNQSFINGNLRKFVINATTYACPVGLGLNSTDYHRLDFISNISGGTSYIDIWVEAISESANNIDANISTAFQDADIIEVLGEDAIWHIVPDVVPVGTYGVKLYVENMGLSDLDDNKFFVTKRPESSSDYSDWDTFDDIVSIPANGADGRIFNGGSGYAQANGFNSFSQYSIAKSNTVLPVEMVSFEVKCDNDVAILSWQTASEINNDYFIIEKSNDLRNFNEIARVKGNGNSNSFKSYTVVDDNANIKVSYYRIIQVDFDGTRNVGNVITSDCFSFTNELPLMIAYPNPFNDELKIAIENCYEQQFIIEIFDNASRLVFAEVYKTNDNTRNLNLDLSYLNPGIYTIRFKSNLHTINKKIAKQ